MSKKIRPSLKDYLKTGEVRTRDFESLKVGREESAQSKDIPEERNSLTHTAQSFLNLLSQEDRDTWISVLRAGAELTELTADCVALREDFRIMNRTRFTCYLLERPGAALRPVRTSVQIREPLELFLKWDEMGALTLFRLTPPAL